MRFDQVWNNEQCFILKLLIYDVHLIRLIWPKQFQLSYTSLEGLDKYNNLNPTVYKHLTLVSSYYLQHDMVICCCYDYTQ